MVAGVGGGGEGEDTLISSLTLPDIGLDACVKSSGATYVSELRSLNCKEASITDLTGIEALTNLGSLNLGTNDIGDVEILIVLPRSNLGGMHGFWNDKRGRK